MINKNFLIKLHNYYDDSPLYINTNLIYTIEPWNGKAKITMSISSFLDNDRYYTTESFEEVEKILGNLNA